MIRHLLLDLDNTLYPASGGMDEGITRRMLEFVAGYLGVSFEEGVRLRSDRLPLYGTTLEWLKKEHNLVDQDAYFNAVHPDSEIDELQRDDRLRPYLLSLGLPMTLLTNAPASHAERLLKFFNIEDIFLGAFDLNFHKGIGKPHRDCFLSTLDAVGFSVKETLFVDDHPKYVLGYKAVGGKAVIVDETGRYKDLADKEGFGRIQTIYGLSELLQDGAFSPQTGNY
jgi:putative hydrolase of the HAD superfamily